MAVPEIIDKVRVTKNGKVYLVELIAGNNRVVFASEKPYTRKRDALKAAKATAKQLWAGTHHASCVNRVKEGKPGKGGKLLAEYIMK